MFCTFCVRIYRRYIKHYYYYMVPNDIKPMRQLADCGFKSTVNLFVPFYLDVMGLVRECLNRLFFIHFLEFNYVGGLF